MEHWQESEFEDIQQPADPRTCHHEIVKLYDLGTHSDYGCIKCKVRGTLELLTADNRIIELLTDEYKDCDMINSSLVSAGSDIEGNLHKAIMKLYVTEVWEKTPDEDHYCCDYKLTPVGRQAIQNYLAKQTNR